MSRKIFTIVSLFIGLGFFTLAEGQQSQLGRLRLFPAREKTPQQVSWASSARLKLISRKSAYHYGEAIDLSLGLLNISPQTLFFIRPDIVPLVTITAKDETGRAQQIRENEVFGVNVAPESYSLVLPQYMLVARFHLIAGCDTPELQAWREKKTAFYDDAKRAEFKYQRELFERGLYGDFEYGCLNYEKEGNYTFSIAVTNEHVLVASARQDIKTAVGDISSAPLQLKIYR